MLDITCFGDPQPKFTCKQCGFNFYANAYETVGSAMAKAVSAATAVGQGIAITAEEPESESQPDPMDQPKCIRAGCWNPKEPNSALCHTHRQLKIAQQELLAAKKIKPASSMLPQSANSSPDVVEAAARLVIVPED